MPAMIRTFDPVAIRSRQVPVDPPRTALLSIDMQNADCGPGLRARGIAGEPKPPRTPYFYRRLADLVIPNQVRLHAAARVAGIENIYAVIESLTEDGRDRSIDHKVSNIHVPPGSPDGQVIDEVKPQPGEIVVRKTASGVFGATNLDYILRNLGIQYLIVFGVVTHQCVENSVRQAADIGYLVTVVGDACATDSDEVHDAALHGMAGYARILDTDEVIAEIAGQQQSQQRAAGKPAR